MSITKINTRQIQNVSALPAIGSAANATLDVILGDIETLFADATYLPTPSVIMTRDANANTQINNIVENFTTTVTAAGTTTLTVASTYFQQFTGTTTQTVTLPNTSTLLAAGQSFAIFNNSTGNVTVNAFGGGLIQTMATETQAIFTASSISAQTWDVLYSISNPLSNPMTAAGQMIYGAAGGTPTAVAAGTTGEILISNGTGAPTFTSTIPAATLFSAGLQRPIVNTSSNYAGSDTDYAIDVFTSGSVDVSLPSAVGISGQEFVITATDNVFQQVAILTTGGQTIGSRPSGNIVLSNWNDFVHVISDGTNYQIIGKKETEVLTASNSGNLGSGASNLFVTGVAITLQPGQWSVTGSIGIQGTSVGLSSYTNLNPSSGFYSGNGPTGGSLPALTGQALGFTNMNGVPLQLTPNNSGGGQAAFTFPPFTYIINASQSFYLVPNITTNGMIIDYAVNIMATRLY